ALRPGVARQRLEEVVRGVLRLQLLRVLALPAVSQEHEVAGPRRQLLAPERLLRPPAERQLADRMLAAANNRCRKRLRLVDRRHGLRLQADLLTRAVELRRVDRTGKDDADVDTGAFLLLLDAHALEERAEGRLRRAVRGLQRDGAIRQRRRDLDERAARLPQLRQRRPEP